MLAPESSIVLGADTLITYAQQVFEKPKNAEHFHEMMQQLSGQTHQVLTAIALATAHSLTSKVIQSSVTFCTLTQEQILSLIHI